MLLGTGRPDRVGHPLINEEQRARRRVTVAEQLERSRQRRVVEPLPTCVAFALPDVGIGVRLLNSVELRRRPLTAELLRPVDLRVTLSDVAQLRRSRERRPTVVHRVRVTQLPVIRQRVGERDLLEVSGGDGPGAMARLTRLHHTAVRDAVRTRPRPRLVREPRRRLLIPRRLRQALVQRLEEPDDLRATPVDHQAATASEPWRASTRAMLSIGMSPITFAASSSHSIAADFPSTDCAYASMN